MKYTILGFQQEKLIESGLSVEDAFILRMIKDMYSSAGMEFKFIDNNKYMWMNYTYMLKQIPIVGSKRNLMRKIEHYGNELLLLRVLEHERKGTKGNYSYIAPTEKLDMLQDFDLMTESHKGYDKNDIRVMTESHNKDTSIIDSSIKDTNNSAIADIWKAYPNKKGKVAAVKKIPKLLKEYEADIILQAIDRYKADVEVRRITFKDLQYQNGSTFFNSGYADYIGEDYDGIPPTGQSEEAKPIKSMWNNAKKY